MIFDGTHFFNATFDYYISQRILRSLVQRRWGESIKLIVKCSFNYNSVKWISELLESSIRVYFAVSGCRICPRRTDRIRYYYTSTRLGRLFGIACKLAAATTCLRTPFTCNFRMPHMPLTSYTLLPFYGSLLNASTKILTSQPTTLLINDVFNVIWTYYQCYNFSVIN